MLTCFTLLYFDESSRKYEAAFGLQARSIMVCKMDHNSECISPFIDFCHLDNYQKSKLIRLISYIILVHVPSFLLIHLKPSAAEGPRITLFQRDLLLAHREIDSELADVVPKHFYEHAVRWMSPVNIALGVFAEVPPYSIFFKCHG